MTDFVADFVRRLDIGENRTRIAVVYWSDTAHVGFTLDTYYTRQDITQVNNRFKIDLNVDHILLPADKFYYRSLEI